MATKVELHLLTVYGFLAAPGIKALVSGLTFPIGHHKDFADKRRHAQANIDKKQVKVLSRLLVDVREGVPQDLLVTGTAPELVTSIKALLDEDAGYLGLQEESGPLRELEELGAARGRLTSLPSESARWALCKSGACLGYLAALSFLAFPYIFSNFHFSDKSKIISLVIAAVTGSFAIAFFGLGVVLGRRFVRILDEHG